MAAPIEFRYYLREYTIEDVKAGVQPLRQFVAGRVKFFAPASLQWRARERSASADGKVSMEWGPWSDVLYVRAGDDQAGETQAEGPAAA